MGLFAHLRPDDGERGVVLAAGLSHLSTAANAPGVFVVPECELYNAQDWTVTAKVPYFQGSAVLTTIIFFNGIAGNNASAAGRLLLLESALTYGI